MKRSRLYRTIVVFGSALGVGAIGGSVVSGVSGCDDHGKHLDAGWSGIADGPPPPDGWNTIADAPNDAPHDAGVIDGHGDAHPGSAGDA